MHLRVLLLTAAVHAVTAEAAIFGTDDRIHVAGTEQSAFAAIGRISWRNRRATGFLVSNCDVLTTKHVYSDKRPALGRRMTFSVTLQTGERFSSEGAVIASGDFDITAQRANPSLGRSADWLLLRLDECLGRALGHFELVPEDIPLSELATAQGVRSAGFPGIAAVPWASLDPECRVHGEMNEEWLNDCASLPGSSGSPIFQHRRLDGRDVFRLIGMQTSAWPWREPQPYNAAYANRATKIGYLARQIKPHIAND